MLIGSNNSLTYLRPSSWWSKIFRLFNKCQTANFKEQYDYCGVRLFDLKLYADEHCHMVGKNGFVKYPIFSLYEILSYLDKKGDVTIRITFEATEWDANADIEYERIEKKFIHICNILETIYPKIKYFGGRRAYDNKKLYSFKYEERYGAPNIIDVANSTWLFRTFPILSSLTNRRNIKKYEKEEGFLLLNFVDIR
jgi:hypothetical protein